MLTLCAALLASGPLGHTKLLAPPEWLVTDSYGDPQKTGPCGSMTGTESHAITTLQAGAPYTVKWSEPIGHPGHFRISLAPQQSDFVTPTAVVSAGNCVSAPIETNPTLPTLMDGVHPHSVARSGATWEQTITVPNTPCDACWLQVTQFMSSHAPPCFYFHCAAVRIVASDGGFDAGEPIVTTLDGGSDAPPPATGCGCHSASIGVLPLALLTALVRRRPHHTARTPAAVR